LGNLEIKDSREAENKSIQKDEGMIRSTEYPIRNDIIVTAMKLSNNSNCEITEKSTSVSNSVMSTPEL